MPAEILILGGGFAGLAAAEELAGRGGAREYRVRLIDRRRDSVFAPLLPDLISGRVQREHIAYSLERYCRRRGIEYIHANIKSIDLKARRVEAFEGTWEADYIIICLGCDTNYFGDEDTKRHALGLKWIEEGVTLNERARHLIDTAVQGGERANMVVVGGGYTGIEAASHLAYLVKTRTRLPYHETGRYARVIIVEKMPRLLATVPGDAQPWAEELMKNYNIEVRTNVTVTSLNSGQELTLTDGTTIAKPLVLWATGVTPGPAAAALELPKNDSGRLKVDPFLCLPGVKNVFAAGDVCSPEPAGHHLPLRMAVQFSLEGGRTAAANVRRSIEGGSLREFKPLDLGYVVPLAPGHAASVILGREATGLTPFLLHYFMSVYRSYGWRNRLGILGDIWKEIMTSE